MAVTEESACKLKVANKHNLSLIYMSEDVLNAQRMLPILKNLLHSNMQLLPLNNIPKPAPPQKPKLQKIMHKYRIQNLVGSFKSKLKRNNEYGMPVQFQIKSGVQKDEERWIKWEGLDFHHKKLQSMVFVGDIVFSLLIFYLSVFQAFLGEFRDQIAGTAPIVVIKMLAVLFEFLKITLKSVKKEVVDGIWMTFLTDIVFYSADVVELVISFSAIFIIVLSAISPGDASIGAASFIIAAVKLFLIPKNIKVLQIHYINSVRKQQYWDLIKVIIFELFFGHFISGLLLAMAQIHPTQNWIVAKGLVGSDWNILYYWAIYWSATLITTTGFGDYIAYNSNQAIIVAFIEFFSSAVLVYNINLIGTIIMSMRNSDCALEKKLAIFRRMNDQNPVAPGLQGKIRSFISYENQIKELFQFNERESLLKELPEQLRKQYNNDMNQSIFRKLPFFRHLRIQSMVSLANTFQARVYYPGEYLVRNRIGISTVFILRNGKVGLIYQKDGSSMNGVVVDQMSVNSRSRDYQPALLTKTFMKRSSTINYDIQALDYSLIMNIKQEELLNVLRMSPLDFQHFSTIYDKHEINFRFESGVCPHCSNQYHSKFDCPRLHYIPFKFIVVYNHLNLPSKPTRSYRYRRDSLRKEHCYYLRKDFFKLYEKINNFNAKREITKMIDELQLCPIDHENQASKERFFEQCENIIRKVVEEKRESETEEKKFFWCIDCDYARDFSGYFLQSNPSKLQSLNIKKSKKKLRRLFTVATNLSNKLLYRSDLFNMPLKGLAVVHENEACESSHVQNKERSP